MQFMQSRTSRGQFFTVADMNHAYSVHICMVGPNNRKKIRPQGIMLPSTFRHVQLPVPARSMSGWSLIVQALPGHDKL
jgi:hypothetical protein